MNGTDSHDDLADLGTSPFVQETCTVKNASPQILRGILLGISIGKRLSEIVPEVALL